MRNVAIDEQDELAEPGRLNRAAVCLDRLWDGLFVSLAAVRFRRDSWAAAGDDVREAWQSVGAVLESAMDEHGSTLSSSD